MANEASITINFGARKNGAEVAGNVVFNVDMTGDTMLGSVQAIGTAAEALTFEDIATPGYVFLRNLTDPLVSPTAFIEIALDSGVSTQKFAKLFAGKGMIWPTATGTLYAKASVAQNLQKVAIAT